jgi:hypothetical protein
MFVSYASGGLYKLSCRVNKNPQNGRWTAHGINPHGINVLVDIEE